MSSNKFAAASVVDLPPSPRLAVLLVGAHLAASTALLSLPLPLFVVAPVLALIAWSGIHTVRRHALRSDADAIVRVTRNDDETWVLTRRDGGSASATLRPGSFVHPALLVLNFVAEEKKKFAVVLATNGVNSDDVRRLRAKLRSGSTVDG